MNIMSKLIKRLQKEVKFLENTILLGCGFGHFDDIVESFDTVFIINAQSTEIKRKNIVYREDFNHIEQLSDVNSIFVDRNRVDAIAGLRPAWMKRKMAIIIEGSEVIDRQTASSLWESGYRAVEQYKDYHVWKRIQ
jgi:hypothetical protein